MWRLPLSLSSTHLFPLHPFVLSWWGVAGRRPRWPPHFAASEPAEIYGSDKTRLEATGSGVGGGGAALSGHARRSDNQMTVWNESAGKGAG